MKTNIFQKKVLQCIKDHLKINDVSTERLSYIAKQALILSDEHPKKIPEEAINAFFNQNPECEKNTNNFNTEENATKCSGIFGKFKKFFISILK